MPQATTSEAALTLWQRLWYTRLRDAARGRFDGSLDWRRELAEAGLPDELRQLVHDTVRATRLWNCEKVDVTRELVAHFQDGLERGRQAPVLLATFGDPKATAALVRRAKKRGRPFIWHIWHYGWIALATLTLLYVLTGLWMMFDRPSVKVDYLAIINAEAKSVPEAERAWPLYRAALLELGPKTVPGEYYPETAIPHSEAKPGDAEWPQLEKLLRDHSDSVAKLRAAAGRHGLGFVPANSFVAFTPEDRRLFGVDVTDEQVKAFQSQTVEDRWIIATLLPNLQQLRSAAFVLAADARRAAADGDGKTALADVTALFGVGRHAQETPFLVNLLVAAAVQRIACDTIQDLCQDNSQLWSNAELRDLAHTIAASPIEWRKGFQGETAGFRDTMQRLYTDDGRGDGRLAFRSSMQQNLFELLDSMIGPGADNVSTYYANDGFAMLMLPAANMVVAPRKEMTETYEAFTNSAMLKIGAPLWEQQELVPWDDAFLSDHAGLVDKYRYMFVRLMAPAYDRLRNQIATIDGQRDGVLMGIALESYHRAHNAWPKTLGELSPRWLPAVPVDRISGKSLGYKIVDDRPVVYSVGVDRDDDGGRAPLSTDDQLNADLASPQHFRLEPVTGSEHDGDWVIWSTVESK